MEYSNERIDALKAAVVETFGRTLDAPTDFDALSSEIQNKTGEAISPSTLKRLYGYIKPATVPRPSTLSTLARYAGFSGWSDFCDRCIEPIASEKQGKRSVFLYFILSGIGICVLVFILWFVGVAPPVRTNPNTEQQISEPESKDSDAVVLSASESDANSSEDSEHLIFILPKSENRKVAAQAASAPETGGDEVPIHPTLAAETPEQKAERIKQRYVVIAKGRCDSIRNLRSGMDIITYKETVDDFYFPFVFTELKNSIDEQVAAVFPEDDSLATRYRNEIFSLCREICVELMREIPADELTKAYREKSGLRD
ncbi:MAG: hypothetical protein NC250_06550 [Alistipes senegalensis]|nr:hypothetical protein [Alistipes senegalensis]